MSTTEIIDLILTMAEAGEDISTLGFCLTCGEEHYGIEPDACAYECDACGAREVYGADEILLREY